jgi:hypothetical protein
MKATSSLAKAWKADAERSSRYGYHVSKFSASIQTLITAEAPDSLPVITPTLLLLDKWSAVNSDIAATKLRVSNDIRDLVERYRVVERITDHRKSAIKALESAKSKLSAYEDEVSVESKRKDYNLKRAELNLAKLRIAKKEALIRARDLTALLIEQRRRFSRFLFRRTREAYVRYGEMLVRDSPLELAILEKTIEALQKARAGEVLEAIDIAVPAVVPLSFADDDGPPEPLEASPVLVEEPPKPAKREEIAAPRPKLFDAAEIEANLPKKAEEDQPPDDAWAGVDVQPVDEGKTFFEVEIPAAEPTGDVPKQKKAKAAPKKGRGKKALATPSPFDEI